MPLAPSVYGSLREAITATATRSALPMKALASELDWSPSELSHRTTLGGENSRPFPADDEHFIKLMRVTGDCSILATIADLLGFEIVPKRERLAEMVTGLNERLATIQSDMRQLTLVLGDERKKGGGR